MELLLERISSAQESTIGTLFAKSGDKLHFLCFTIEDEYRAVKVKSETRIPAGRYELGLRKEGGFHTRYSKLFGGIHRGMLHLQSVPGFEFILIHCGNSDADSAGCILLGDNAWQNITARGVISASQPCYKRVYPDIAAALERSEPTFITIVDRA